jgi:hypothetical protein
VRPADEHRLLPLTCLVLVLPLASCASRSLTIQSNPSGAEVYLDREYVGLTPVTVPFVYGGEREILLYRPKRPGETKRWRPHRMIWDTTRDDFDFPIIDLAADLSGAEDRQKVDVAMKESNAAELYDADPKSFRAAMRARADTLRARAREFQLGALPTSQGRDPGPLDTRQSTTRPEPAKPDSP